MYKREKSVGFSSDSDYCSDSDNPFNVLLKGDKKTNLNQISCQNTQQHTRASNASTPTLPKTDEVQFPDTLITLTSTQKNTDLASTQNDNLSNIQVQLH